MIILTLVLLGLLAFICQRYYRRILAPAVLMPLIWFFILLLHTIFGRTLLPQLRPLQDETMLIFTAGPFLFCLGSFVSSFLKRPYSQSIGPLQENLQSHSPLSVHLRIFLVLLCAIMLPFYVKQVIQVFVASQIDNFFVGLRTELTYGDVDLGVLKYFINFSIVVFGICLAESSINATRANIIISWFAFVLAFFYALFSTGRTYFLFIFMMFFGVSTMLKKNFRIYRFLWFFPLIIALFTAYGLVYGKGGSFEENFAENLKSSSENTAVYIAGSLSAFDWEVENRLRPDGSALNSMRFFYVIGEKLGLVNPASVKKDLVQDFVSIPYEVNVYTVYSPYLRDFGIIYAMGMLFLFGWLHTWLFHKAEETKSANYSLYYAMLLFPLAMAFFQDQYMSLFSMWIQNIMFIEGILLINRLFFSGSSITAKKK